MNFKTEVIACLVTYCRVSRTNRYILAVFLAFFGVPTKGCLLKH